MCQTRNWPGAGLNIRLNPFVNITLSARKSWIIAWLLITVFAIAAFASSWDDSPSFDEPEHITGGYQALWAQIFFPNPYHPPLVKDVAALGVAAINPRPPSDCPTSPMTMGKELIKCFFFWLGNDPQHLVRAARTPIILLFCLALVCYFARLQSLFSSAEALFALWMLVFSPTVIAHSRFVHTDMAVSFACFICISFMSDYLSQPNKKTVAKLALATGMAQLVKFSALLLFPLYGLTGVWYLLISKGDNTSLEKVRGLKLFACHMCIFFLVSIIVVWLTYAWQTAHLDIHFQRHYDLFVFERRHQQLLPRLIFSIDTVPGLRALSWYLTGLASLLPRLSEGHTSMQYFHGGFSRQGNFLYFPTLWITKEPLAYIILELIAASYWLKQLLTRLFAKHSLRFQQTPKSTFLLCSTFFLYLYLLSAVCCSLNLGIRHLLPAFPVVYALTASAIVNIRRHLKERAARLSFVVLSSVLVLWASLSSAMAFPGYLQYFNELAGGKQGGPSIAIDSNFDWGTDCYRLKKYLQQNHIDTVYVAWVHYFSPEDYFGKTAKNLVITRNYPSGSVLAISVGARQELKGMLASPDLVRLDPHQVSVVVPQPYDPSALEWLLSLEPCAKVGETILIVRTP